jgi:hypothetical protein
MDIRITLAAQLLRRNQPLFTDYKGDRIKSWLYQIAGEAKKRTLRLKEAEDVIRHIKALRGQA